MAERDAERAGKGRQGASEIVRLLESALAPVEPPARLGDELERRLSEMQAAALDELSDWEMAAMRDPRNWVRPAAAVAVGTAAGAALLVLRVRRVQRQRSGLPGLADHARRDLLEAIAGARARLR
jgi:hypothetical protein